MAKVLVKKDNPAVVACNATAAEIVACLRATLPPVFARRDVPKYFGSSLPVGTIANMGKSGPPYVRRRRHAIYSKESFLAWYESWLMNADHNKS